MKDMKKKMKNILVTNNSLVNETYKENIEIIYLESLDYLKVLETVRDKVHLGHKLLTHPLSGSVKPNETPFKSVIISEEVGSMDFDSLNIIEESILTAKKFLDQRKIKDWPDEVLKDFRTIDFSIITSGIESMNQLF